MIVKRRRKLRGAAVSAHALEVLARLKKEYPDARTELDFETPFQLLIATILSAQCTDKRVNLVTPALFREFPTAHDLACAEVARLEDMIRTTGFFRNKTKSLLGMSAALVERHGGEVPRTMAELVELPGVGRKTANVVLGNALDASEGLKPSERRINIKTRSDQGDVAEVTVRDFGVGLPQDRPDKIFDHFFSTKQKGMGMGLAIVRSIVEAHGGTIAAENAPDRGARIIVRLPAARGEVERNKAAA